MPPRKKQTVAEQPALKANPGCCEEASTLSHKFYIPCNQPAAAIVGWKGRDDKPIRMCGMCENHNIHNRGGYRVEALAPPIAGDSSESKTPFFDSIANLETDDALIAENFQIEDLIKAASAKFDEWAKPHKERIKQIEDDLFARLSSRGADSTKTNSGTAYISNLASVKIESAEQLFDFAAENWAACGDEIKLSMGIKAVRAWMDEHDGQLPPGISLSKYSRLNIKRS